METKGLGEGPRQAAEAPEAAASCARSKPGPCRCQGLPLNRSGHGGIREQRKFYPAAHRIDAFGTHTDPIAESPRQSLDLPAAPSTPTAFAAQDRHDGMIVLAINAARFRHLFERADRHQSFHELIE